MSYHYLSVSSVDGLDTPIETKVLIAFYFILTGEATNKRTATNCLLVHFLLYSVLRHKITFV